MTNKEKYQKTFSALHTSAELLLEVRSMEKNKKRPIPRWAAACAAVVMTLGLSLGVYAADIGGIRKIIQIWLHGEQTDLVLELTENGYEVFREGEDTPYMCNFVTTKHNEKPRPMTEEEVIEHLKNPDVEYYDDGSVWLYYEDQKIEITDQFDENGVCRITVRGSDRILDLTIHHFDHSTGKSSVEWKERFYPEYKQ